MSDAPTRHPTETSTTAVNAEPIDCLPFGDHASRSSSVEDSRSLALTDALHADWLVSLQRNPPRAPSSPCQGRDGVHRGMRTEARAGSHVTPLRASRSSPNEEAVGAA